MIAACLSCLSIDTLWHNIFTGKNTNTGAVILLFAKLIIKLGEYGTLPVCYGFPAESAPFFHLLTPHHPC